MKTYITLFMSLFTIYCMAGEDPRLKKIKQEDDDGHQNGIRIGWQMSNIYKGGDKGNKDLNFGYVGYLRQIRVAGIFRIETGLEYMMAGSKFTDSSELQLNYIVLPAQAVLKLGPFLAMGGINAMFMVADKYEVRDNKVDLSGDKKINWFDVSLDAGIGFNILFVAVEARYYWGLIELNDSAYSGYKNQYLQVGLKFHF